MSGESNPSMIDLYGTCQELGVHLTYKHNKDSQNKLKNGYCLFIVSKNLTFYKL